MNDFHIHQRAPGGAPEPTPREAELLLALQEIRKYGGHYSATVAERAIAALSDHPPSAPDALGTAAFHFTPRQVSIICEGLRLVQRNPASADECATAERIALYLSQPQANKAPAANAGGLSAYPTFQHPDDSAVDRFAAAMKAKMAASRAKGRNGWDNEVLCPTARLQAMLVEHIGKGDPVDVGNFAMMLFNRGDRATATSAAALPPDYIPESWKLLVAGLINQLDAIYKALGRGEGKQLVVSIGQFRALDTAKRMLRDAGLPNVTVPGEDTPTAKGAAGREGAV